jgi:hypothetical protein
VAARLVNLALKGLQRTGEGIEELRRRIGRLVIVSLFGILKRSLGWAEAMPNAHAFVRAPASLTWAC